MSELRLHEGVEAISAAVDPSEENLACLGQGDHTRMRGGEEAIRREGGIGEGRGRGMMRYREPKREQRRERKEKKRKEVPHG